MRIAIGLWLGMALLAARPATAAIPLNVRQRSDLHRITDLPALGQLLPIARIERIAPNVWRVTGGRCHVDVTMVEQSGGPGYGLAAPWMEPRAGPLVCAS